MTQALALFVLWLGMVMVAGTLGMAGMPGGVMETELEEDYEPVVYAVQQINAMFAARGDSRQRELEEIVEAQTQVVAGQKLYLTLHVSGGDEHEYCYIEVVFAAWFEPNDPHGERLRVVRGPECSTSPPTEAPMIMPGGEYPIHDLSDDVLAALSFAEEEYNRQSDHANVFHLAADPSDLTITGQTILGYRYRFYDVPLHETECVKRRGTTQSSCQEKEDGMEDTCTLTVWDQPWENPRFSLEAMDCSLQSQVQAQAAD